MKSGKRSRHAVAWLETEPGFARLGEHAARLAALQVDLHACAPGMALAVIALERDVLVVGAAHAAVAAKVRQTTPTIVAALARRGWRIASIRFKPQWRPAVSAPVRAVKSVPDARAVEGIDALAERVDHARLKAALRRLAGRHRAPEPPRT